MYIFLRKLFVGLLFTALSFTALEVVLHVLPQDYWLRKPNAAVVAKKEDGEKAYHPQPASVEALRQEDTAQQANTKSGVVRSGKVGSESVAVRKSAPATNLQENIPSHGDAQFLSVLVPLAKGYHSNKYGEFSIDICINSHGLRDVERPWEKPEGVFRILALGDSFTEAFQVNVDETFSKRLQSLLGESLADYTYDVINAGVSGYSPLIYYLLYTYRLRKYSPDIVALFISDEQIVRDNVYKKFAVFGKFGLPTACVHPELIQDSFLTKRYKKLKDEFYSILFLDSRLKLFWNNRIQESSNTDDSAFSLKLLNALRKECRVDGAELMIVYLPNRPETRRRQLAGGERAREEVSETLRLFCKKEDVEYLDLSPVFIDWKGASLYYQHDGHLTVEGHKVVAERSAERLLAYVKMRKAGAQGN